MDTLGEKIKQLRRRAGLSQEELGNAIGVSRQAVSKWEMDEQQPKAKTLRALSCYFDVEINYFLGEMASTDAMKRPAEQTLGDRLYAIRKKAGLSQTELAEELQVRRQLVSKWERNALKPKGDVLREICAYFQVDESYFYGSPEEEVCAPKLEPKRQQESSASAQEDAKQDDIAKPKLSKKVLATVIVLPIIMIFIILISGTLICLFATPEYGDQTVHSISGGLSPLGVVILVSIIGTILMAACIVYMVYCLKTNKKDSKLHKIQ